MKKILLAIVCFLAPVASAYAQVPTAIARATCGAQSLTAGRYFPLAIDLTGNLCTSGGGGGGGGAVTVADGADVTQGAKADAAYAGSGAATVVAILKGIYASVNGAIAVGTNNIGTVSGSNVGGYDANPATTPTIQNASYASGNCMGGFQAVALARTTGGTGIINKFSLVSTGGATTALQVYVFDTNPSGSTCTDKSTFTIVAADQSKLVTSFALTPAALTGVSWTEAEASNMGIPFVTSGNSNVYVAIVAGGTFTPASTTDFKFRIGASQD